MAPAEGDARVERRADCRYNDLIVEKSVKRRAAGGRRPDLPGPHWQRRGKEMFEKPFVISLATVFAGWLGGMSSTYLLQPESVVAQGSNGVVADRIALVDSRGTTRASFGLSGGDQQFTYLWMADQAGRKRLDFLVYPDARPARIAFYGTRDDTLAVLPASSAAGAASGDQVAPLRRMPLAGAQSGGKADQAGVTYGDIRPIVAQLQIMMDKLDELASFH